MAITALECAASSLLCPEDNNSIMGFEDDDDDDDDRAVDGDNQQCYYDDDDHHHHHQNYSFFGGFLMGFPLMNDECLGLMVEREWWHMPNEDYMKRLKSGVLESSVRRDAVDWIAKVHAHYSFGPLSAYLSINYLDRFLSAYELPKGKAWMMQLLSVACLSLAAKMEETEVPLSLDLQVGESKFVFEARTIQRMELLVLSTLKWRMQAVTPFSYIDCFLQRINEDQPLPKPCFFRSVELILSTIKGIEFLEFRPSEVAAAVAIAVLRETETVDIDKAISCCVYVEKERVLKCYELIEEVSLISRPVKNVQGSVSSVPRSPIGVLDAACLSYKSDDITVGSCENSQSSPPAAKRRKLNRLSEMDSKS